MDLGPLFQHQQKWSNRPSTTTSTWWASVVGRRSQTLVPELIEGLETAALTFWWCRRGHTARRPRSPIRQWSSRGLARGRPSPSLRRISSICCSRLTPSIPSATAVLESIGPSESGHAPLPGGINSRFRSSRRCSEPPHALVKATSWLSFGRQCVGCIQGVSFEHLDIPQNGRSPCFRKG